MIELWDIFSVTVIVSIVIVFIFLFILFINLVADVVTELSWEHSEGNKRN